MSLRGCGAGGPGLVTRLARGLCGGTVGVLLAAVVTVASPGAAHGQSAGGGEDLDTVEKLGSALFSERNLSFSRKQNCVSCHSPELAFTDPRALGNIQGAVSRGGDGHSFGDRNAPTLGYLALAPEFRLSPEGVPAGGMFWDGRARDLEAQIHDPLTNPVEMAMPDTASVVARVNESTEYRAALAALFGESVLTDTAQTFAAIEKAIGAFLREPDFAPFDSKYDRSLRGEATLSAAEAAGRDLFFSRERTACSRCHAQDASGGNRAEPFTNFGYYNLGVPVNATVRRLNGSPPGRIDRGVLENPAVSAPEYDGAFKVPTLRNVAVTGPYMHNGVFQELRTAVLFHLRFSAPDGAAGRVNPETGKPWDGAEVPGTVAEATLRAPPLQDSDVDNLIAFLETLTDRRSEHLVAK